MTKTSSNLAATAGSISAATAVFDNPDTRKQIWDFLDRADWVVLMRVSKEGLVESVRRVYRSMECDRVLKMNKANIDEERKALYFGAIVEIDALIMKSLPPHLDAKVVYPTDGDYPNPNKQLLDHRGVFEDVVHLLRGLCPSLRRVHFGALFPTPYGLPNSGGQYSATEYWYKWNVHLYPAAAPKEGICFVDCLTKAVVACDRPPAVIPCPIPPSPNYTLRHRFDVTVGGVPIPISAEQPAFGHPDYMADHLRVMKAPSQSSGLHQILNFGLYHISLGDLQEIVTAQIQAGYPVMERLSQVSASSTPYDVHDFNTFATIASASLVRFCVSAPVETTGITFKNLPEVFGTIRASLPNLRQLVLAVGGIQEADALYEDLLTSDILSRRGQLNLIRIDTEVSAGCPLFALLRYLRQYVEEAELPDVEIRTWDYNEKWQSYHQRNMLEYLRSQTPERRHHLSTVSFPSIGVYDPISVLSLAYDDDGRPYVKR